MKVSYEWLQTYFDKPLPKPSELVDLLSLHAFEIEGVEKVGDDTVIDVDVLPNRAHDALSHNGIARELGVLLDRPVNFPEESIRTDKTLKSSDSLSLSVEDSNLVRRATKRLVVDVKVGESPEWLRNRLEAIGQKSINNIVDATNYVTFETNQPVHAFDYDKLAGKDKKEISVRRAKKGERIQTLDGEEFTLDDTMLVISDSEKALDIAGIKGGANSGIDEKTKRIVLSICNFDPVNIRRTSGTLGLKTDASKRFENGITPELVSVAMGRLSTLVQELSGGRVAEDHLDIYPWNLGNRSQSYRMVGVSVSEINSLLGLDMSSDDVESVLGRLGFSYEFVKPRETILEVAQELEGKPYKYGASVTFDSPKAFDCSSFVSYVHLLAGVSVPRMAVDQYVFGEDITAEGLKPGDLVFSDKGQDGAEEFVERLGKKIKRTTSESVEFMPGTKIDGNADHVGVFLGEGAVIHASEVLGKVLSEKIEESESFKKILGYRRMLKSEDPRYVVTVPPERIDLMRTRGFMISGNKEDLIEEIGRVYGYEKVKPTLLRKDAEPKANKIYYYSNKVRDILAEEGFYDVYTYSLGDKGEVELINPFTSEKSKLRSSLEGGLADLFSSSTSMLPLLGLEFGALGIFEIGKVFKTGLEFIQLGIASDKVEDIVEKVKGILKRELGSAPEFRMSTHNVVAVTNFTDYINGLPDPISYEDLNDLKREIKYTPFSQYPFVSRDLSLWCSPSGSASHEVHEVIKEGGGKLLVKSWLFDEYNKEDGAISYGFRLVFQSSEKTLSDEEVNAIMKRINKAVEGKGWEVR